MRKSIIIGLYIFLYASSFGAMGEENQGLNASVWGYDTGWLILKNTESIDVHLNDEVQDGCWTDLSGVRNVVELQLIRSGYETQRGEDGSIFVPDVVIGAVGYEIPGLGSCAVAVKLEASVPDFSEYTVGDGVLSSLHSKSVITYSAVLTARKANANSMIKGQFESMVQQLLVDMERVKQRMRGALEEQEQGSGTRYWIEQLK
ncbi:hypothetical protein ACQUWM_16215 [Marinobacter sp. DUT-3]|uniref:hypothetical protein n=1 Tax=Marinobacter sp. DUT-3 TaxID=3412036 RepID=UPI003D17B32F